MENGASPVGDCGGPVMTKVIAKRADSARCLLMWMFPGVSQFRDGMFRAAIFL